MNQDLITRTLAEHATSVDHRGPDLGSLHARVATARRRRHATAGATAVGALVAAGLTAGLVVGGEGGVPHPAPVPTTPSQSQSESVLPYRTQAVEVLPADDARSQASRVEVIAAPANDPGEPVLEVTVLPEAELIEDLPYCRAALDLWLVVQYGGGARQTMPCTPGADLSPEFPSQPFHTTVRFSDLEPDLPDSPVEPVDVRLFVTTADVDDTPRRLWEEGIPTSTTAQFGLVVHGQTSPIVGTIVGRPVSVLGEFEGRDWWFVRGVEAPTGAETLTVELPASDSDRMVQPVVHDVDIIPPTSSETVQISLDGQDVDHRFDEPRVAFLDETTAFVPAGGPHTIELRLTEGIPENVDLGVAIFEAD